MDHEPLPLASPRPLRLGVVAYLNMQPLVSGLGEAWPAEELELHFDRPSVLARQLAEGKIDMGMVPAGALLCHPEWSVAGSSMIGARGAVQSVLLLGGRPLEAWRRLRPDSHSLTSNALSRILLARHFGLECQLAEPIPPEGWDPPARPAADEGFVLIGSRALRWRNCWPDDPAGCVLDLGEAWTAWTGLPFIFAVWAVRPGVDLGEWPERLERHKARNRERLAEIAASWPDLEHDRLSPAEALDYCNKSIAYDLDDAARAGLERYYREGRALGLFSPDWQWRPYAPPVPLNPNKP